MNTLAIFARPPVLGLVKTRLATELGPEQTLRMYRAFLSDVFDSASHLQDIETTVWSSTKEKAELLKEIVLSKVMQKSSEPPFSWSVQPKGDLGGRIHTALTEQLKNSKKCCIIGTDAPSLPTQYLEEGFELLEKKEIVLGPTSDGGYYLIGACAGAVPSLKGVRFSSPQTLVDTRESCEKQGFSVGLLSPWFDIDIKADLRELQLQLALDPKLAPASARVMATLRGN